jgi:hypothetical protein
MMKIVIDTGVNSQPDKLKHLAAGLSIVSYYGLSERFCPMRLPHRRNNIGFRIIITPDAAMAGKLVKQ